jgi:Glycosyltransferase Family 4
MPPKQRLKLSEEGSSAASTIPSGDAVPRLLYLAEVPVESYMHGSALVYRLFESYPAEKLLIVECLYESQADRRIPNVQYRAIKSSLSRLLNNRFSHYLWPLSLARVYLSSRSISRIVRNYRPQVVITVVVRHAWEVAASYATRAGLPLHLIVHDDWPNNPNCTSLQRRWAHWALRRWYPMAASRLCISPYMAEEFSRRYGAKGDVLYPSRGSNTLEFEAPPPSLNGSCKPFTVAFCGSIYLDYARALQRMAIALQDVGGRLLVFGPKPFAGVDVFLQEPNIELQGTLSSLEVIRRCREQAHAIFVPMAYCERDRHNMEISFPSKLADCTATGLPLIIDGPDYCSAIRWARENPGVSEIVTDESVDGLRTALQKLQDPAVRFRLAREAIRRGKEYFGHDRALSTLMNKLCGNTTSKH